MGIYDRDYVRSAPANGGLRSAGRLGPLGGWGVTHWLIVLCVAVFFVDRFLPRTTAFLAPGQIITPELFERRGAIAPSDIVQRIAVDSTGQTGEVTYFHRPTGLPIATEYVLIVTPIQKYLQFTTAQALMYPDAQRGLVGFEFWRFFGYQFLHADWTHILFNMLGLWFFGLEVERFLGRKRFLAFYLLCGFFGALLYMLLNAGGVLLLQSGFTWIPPFLPNSPYLPLIGASGSIYGVVIAGAYLAPNERAELLYIIPIKLKTLAFILILVAVATLLTQGPNAGGQAAHLGGAIAGWFFIRRPAMLNNFFDLLGRADPTSRTNRTRREQKRSVELRVEVDRVLAKVHEHGLQSLTEAEKATLREASRL